MQMPGNFPLRTTFISFRVTVVGARRSRFVAASAGLDSLKLIWELKCDFFFFTQKLRQIWRVNQSLVAEGK